MHWDTCTKRFEFNVALNAFDTLRAGILFKRNINHLKRLSAAAPILAIVPFKPASLRMAGIMRSIAEM